MKILHYSESINLSHVIPHDEKDLQYFGWIQKMVLTAENDNIITNLYE